jgi:hypothetical protein
MAKSSQILCDLMSWPPQNLRRHRPLRYPDQDGGADGGDGGGDVGFLILQQHNQPPVRKFAAPASSWLPIHCRRPHHIHPTNFHPTNCLDLLAAAQAGYLMRPHPTCVPQNMRRF